MIHPRAISILWMLAAAPQAQACNLQEPAVPPQSQQQQGGGGLSPEAPKGMWAVKSNGVQRCRIALNGLPEGSGFGVHLEGCDGLLAKVRSWTVRGDQLLLLDGEGRSLLSLGQDHASAFSGMGPDGETYRLESSPEV